MYWLVGSELSLGHDTWQSSQLQYYSFFFLFFQAAEESFASIDLNKDGKLSKKEFIKLGRDFFLSEKEHKPSKLFWGPLV